MEYTGIATASAFDKKVAALYDNGWTNSATTWSCNATGTLSQADEIILVPIIDVYMDMATLAGTGYTSYTVAGNFGGALDKIVSATDSVTPSGTLTRVGTNYTELFVGAVTYKADGGGGSPAPTRKFLGRIFEGQ